MSAAQALALAHAAGVRVRADGDDLVLEASAPPPAAILDLLSRHKPCIVMLLRPGRDGWSAEDWHVFLDARAGIAEFEGGLPRPKAEVRAFACCVVEWIGACRLSRRFRKKRRHMMGGFGSGRPSGSGRGMVEACRSIDVNRLHKADCLRHGWWGGWQWTRDGEKVASITLRAESDRLHLSYRVRVGVGEWEDVAENVRIVRIRCRFGGARPYFICPGMVNGIACRRRVAKLHAPGRYFLCRHCYRLAHASQSEGGWERALRRANKIRQRLGGDPGMVSEFPKKPKGMWQRTYEGLRSQAFEAEMLADHAFAIRFGPLLARVDDSNR